MCSCISYTNQCSFSIYRNVFDLCSKIVNITKQNKTIINFFQQFNIIIYLIDITIPVVIYMLGSAAFNTKPEYF